MFSLVENHSHFTPHPPFLPPNFSTYLRLGFSSCSTLAASVLQEEKIEFCETKGPQSYPAQPSATRFAWYEFGPRSHHVLCEVASLPSPGSSVPIITSASTPSFPSLLHLSKIAQHRMERDFLCLFHDIPLPITRGPTASFTFALVNSSLSVFAVIIFFNTVLFPHSTLYALLAAPPCVSYEPLIYLRQLP